MVISVISMVISVISMVISVGISVTGYSGDPPRMTHSDIKYVLQIIIVFPESILHKSIAGCCRPVRVADVPITARNRFIKNASWLVICLGSRRHVVL